MSVPTLPRSYAAIGDSFTEGMGDELADGTPRGWADLVALGFAHALGAPVGYANFAIRGRLLGPILTEQLEPAIALAPEILSINGGGNDIMRPRVSVAATADRLVAAAERASDAGIRVVVVSGGNPTEHIPLGPVFQRRGDELADAVRARLKRSLHEIAFVDNWGDRELRALRYWSIDRLHLNSLGHARVAANVLAALGVPAPPAGADEPELQRPRTAEYWREYVLPWIGRRLTGRSSGDGRTAKRPTLEPIAPA
ncbi:lysophospholipase L1-like esterase [Microcella putealis]|uniref:Lysophospholipase L1-like esterase n=1 Tax=Microcella putealis TaxID=337005 RepID=A0A4V2EW81_9MICO|nr:SGNH/GDSL hydrolase family protein [Microcella putealis]RZS55070.1 lysophospholipase L1-like esterase [Microcella putealis]TQM19606.1 lysophospholipase L1-like esterase [Microcella putealis]